MRSVLSRMLTGSRTSVIIALCLAISGSATWCGGTTAGTRSTELTPEQLAEDLRVFRQELEAYHTGLYRYTPKAEFDRIFERVSGSLDRPMDAWGLYRQLAPVIATIKCGHSELLLSDALRSEIDTRLPLLPVQVRVLGEQVYVLRDFSDLAGEGRGLAGMEIRSVDGVPTVRLLAAMLAATPGDGDIQTMKRRTLRNWGFSRLLVALSGLEAPYELVVRDPQTGRERSVTVGGVPMPALAEAASRRFPPNPEHERGADLRFLDDGRIAVMTVRSCEGYVDRGRAGGLREFFEASFAEIRDRGVRSLIVDVRNNGGGSDSLGMLLVSYLVERPFTHYRDIYVSPAGHRHLVSTPSGLPSTRFERRDDGQWHYVGHPAWGLRQPSRHAFTGDVYVLMNGGSFSTTSEFLAQMHAHRRAIFVGEECGGAYYGNTAGVSRWVTLPHSKLRLEVPLFAYFVGVEGYEHRTRGVPPDHRVEYSIAEILAGEDKEMALALTLARKR